MSKYHRTILISVNVGLLIAILGFITSFVSFALVFEVFGADSPESRLEQRYGRILFLTSIIASILSFAGSWLLRLSSIPPARQTLLIVDRVVGGILFFLVFLMIVVVILFPPTGAAD